METMFDSSVLLKKQTNPLSPLQSCGFILFDS